jgi:hypothetical protein
VTIPLEVSFETAVTEQRKLPFEFKFQSEP